MLAGRRLYAARTAAEMLQMTTAHDVAKVARREIRMGRAVGNVLAKALALGAPYVKLVGMARGPIAAAMVGKTIGKSIDANELPVYVERFGKTRDEVFVTSAHLREELGRLCRLLRAEKYQEALGATPGDRAAAVARADQLRARFQPVTEPGAAPRDLRALAYEVSARLVHAREALGAAPGEQRTPLELAQAAFDGDLPTRDGKSKSNSKSNPKRNTKRHAHSEPTSPRERAAALAVAVLVPAVLPRVRIVAAWPWALVATVAAERLPPPLATAKETMKPATGAFAAARTVTTKG